MNIIWVSTQLFLVMDAIGNIPFFMSFLKGIPPSKQLTIIVRELIIALIIILFFNFIGEKLLEVLHIGRPAVALAGGVILFLLALKMIFPPDVDEESSELKKIKEPFIVPLAVPLIAGPAVLAMVMTMSHQISKTSIMISGIVIAWVGTLLILLIAPLLSKWLGKKGIIAVERLMGLILIFMSVEMCLQGIKAFFITGSP